MSIGAGFALASDGKALAIETADGQQTMLEADRILVTVGRRPVTSGFGLSTLDLDMVGPFIGIDDRCRTSMRGVFAIGDVTKEPMLAHRAHLQRETKGYHPTQSEAFHEATLKSLGHAVHI